MDNQETELINKGGTLAKKQQCVIFEAKFESNLTGIILEIANCQNVDTIVLK